MRKILLVLSMLMVTFFVSNTFAQQVKLWEKKAGTVSWFSATDNNVRGLAYNPVTNHIIVASRSGGNKMVLLDANTGDSVGTMSVTGISGGTYLFNIPRVTSDGVIYLINLALANGTLTIYRYADEASNPTIAFQGPVSQRTGDAFQITGSGVNTLLYASGSSSPRIYIFSTTDGTTFAKTDSITVPAGAARGGISFVTSGRNSDLWIKGAGTSAFHISSNGTMIDTINGGVVPTGWLNVAYFAPNTGRKYVSFIGMNDATKGNTSPMYDITNSEKWPTLWANPSISLPYNTNSNATGDLAILDGGNGYFKVYALVSNNGVACFKTNMLTIAQSREQTNYVPTRMNDTVTVQGVVFTPNYYTTTGHSFYIWDGTAGINVFKSAITSPVINIGDKIMVTGKITQYNGLTELGTFDSTSYTIISDSNALPTPTVLTVAQYLANGEQYEGALIGFTGLNKAAGTWPTTGANTTLKLNQGTDTLAFYMYKTTDFYTHTEPAWPVDVIGVGSQYSTTTVKNNGYQLYGRYYADILPLGSLPVEFTTFTANVVKNSVVLNWSTATETNNKGFEVERSNGGAFISVGFVNGNGTTTNPKSYSFVDNTIQSGKTYSYRLKQVDFNGAIAYSKTINVNSTAPTTYSLNQNYPNPFNPSTAISFSLPVNAKVTVRLFDVLGREVMTVVNNQLTSGTHTYNVKMDRMSSGIYFYTLEAKGVDGSNFMSTKKMTLMK
jgi:DNA/RNA endonuclease YhcR with UshA esterase domain